MSRKRQQVVPEGHALERPSLDQARGLKDVDPELYEAVQTVLGALRQDMVPSATQEELFRAMNPGVQRNMVAEQSGLDESVLVTFKQNLSLIDAILRRTFNDDGTLALGQDTMGMEPKDVLNLSLKVNQMMVRELPKVYNMDRVQRIETALMNMMSEHLSREQQEAFLLEMEKLSGKM